MGFAALKKIELTNHGTRNSEIDDAERRAVVFYREWAALRPNAPPLLDLIREGMTAAEQNRPRMTVDEVITERRARLTAKGRSERHNKDTRLRLERFAAAFGSKQISEITSTMVERWLHSLKVGPTTLGNYRRALSAVFAHAVRRKAIPASPLAEIDLPDAASPIPGVLSAEELDRLLHAAPPEIRPVLALQALAGLRRAEAERIDWNDIHLQEKHVKIGADIAKTRSRRVVPIEDGLAQWLALDARESGKIAPTPAVYIERLVVARKAAGIAEWPSNCLRHTAASCWLAREEDLGRVSVWLGNSPVVLKKHYDALATRTQAQAWFAVVPDPQRISAP